METSLACLKEKKPVWLEHRKKLKGIRLKTMCCLVGHDKELGFNSSYKNKLLEGLEHRSEMPLT